MVRCLTNFPYFGWRTRRTTSTLLVLAFLSRVTIPSRWRGPVVFGSPEAGPLALGVGVATVITWSPSGQAQVWRWSLPHAKLEAAGACGGWSACPDHPELPSRPRPKPAEPVARRASAGTPP